MISKNQLRREIAEKRNALERDWLEQASAKVVKNLISTSTFQAAQTVALYMATGGEIDLAALFQICWTSAKRTCIPVYDSADRGYHMAEVTRQTQFSAGPYGIREPVDPALVPLSDIDLIMVPGVAFERRGGHRLGRGGGYYDRMLEKFQGVAAAVAFDFQIVPTIPFESHDQPVDLIVTHTEIVNVHNER